MSGRTRMDSDEFYMAIASRENMTIHEAVLAYCNKHRCSVDPKCCKSISNAIMRFYNHFERIRLNERIHLMHSSKAMNTPIQSTSIVDISSMKVGDIVIANWNIADTPGLNGQIVKILVFEGDQVCVKDSCGTISVFNVKNLRHIPKDF